MTKMKKIRKAVFPVAGFGTRFLPATKAMPKELLPIVDKPLIQYAAEEAIAAGIDTLIFVTGRNKRAIEDHFDANNELETMLRAKGKDAQAVAEFRLRLEIDLLECNAVGIPFLHLLQPRQRGLASAAPWSVKVDDRKFVGALDFLIPRRGARILKHRPAG